MAMNIDCVFHLAANPDIRLGTRITDTDLKQGTVATYNIVEAMRLNGVKNIAFASSSSSTRERPDAHTRKPRPVHAHLAVRCQQTSR